MVLMGSRGHHPRVDDLDRRLRGDHVLGGAVVGPDGGVAYPAASLRSMQSNNS
jgi:hypothetical protein